MRLLASLFVVLCFNLLFSMCKSPAPVDNVPVDAFRYTGFDSTGALIVKGYLSLNFLDSANVKGEWHLAAVAKNVQNIGPQLGTGEIVGRFTEDGHLSLNLNPTMVDNNVFLSGVVEERRYTGSWSFSGFAGVLNGGRFEAWR